MLDFVKIKEGHPKQGIRTIYPSFSTLKSKDLMIKGGKFYAVWNEDTELWSTDEDDVIKMVDASLWDYYEKHKEYYPPGETVIVLTMEDGDTKTYDKFKHNCEKQRSDSFVALDGKLIFSNMETKRSDYASKRLPYPLEPGECPSYERIMSTLYSPKERHKIEWCIGSIITGDSIKLQKFLVLYGEAGSGKSTVINIIQMLFKGYYCTFDAKSLGSASKEFSLEAFRDNPLVAIQHDGNLSHIEDNTRLNSLVSHESMLVNEKFMKQYGTSFRSFLVIGSNSPVRITDAKSGLIRRLIDASPSGRKLEETEYWQMFNRIPFELGAIACHCRDVYVANPAYYNNYIPVTMLGATNAFYNFVAEYYYQFKSEDCTSLKIAWTWYNTYCEDAQLKKMNQMAFAEELKNYFREYHDRYRLEDGTRIRKYYVGFRYEKIDGEEEKEEEPEYVIIFDDVPSVFDQMYQDCPAQYATEKGSPKKPWDEVSTKLSDLDTRELHYVRPPNNLICIDFDIKGPDGEKSYDLNLKAASKWPPTYAELSKSGKAIHLYYIYNGDVSKLSSVYDNDIEVKVFNGKAALRRKLSLCNSLPISIISSGLPLKEEKKMINKDSMMTERGLRTFVKKNLNKEYHADTRSSIDFIYKGLNDMFESGKPYDISDMRNAVLQFAANSTNQSQYCVKLVNKMHFKSADVSEGTEANSEDPLIFFDCEVFPNLVLVCWKMEGVGRPVHRMFNPSPSEIEQMLAWKLVGFNCRRYDNHILYALLLGWSPEQVYNLSQRIIGGDKNAFFGEAYNLSYTDIYDFSSKKQSLKKFEIELGIFHLELGLPWDQPVPEDLWDKVAEYCDNDVIATEAVFNARKADFLAREILADVAGMTVNDTTNSLTTRIIFGKNRTPQAAFNYRDMGDSKAIARTIEGLPFTCFDDHYRPIFPGYRYEFGVSTYRDEEVGEGGYVYSEPGMYRNVALLDIASMHPSSIIAEELFGPEYTAKFKEIYDARIAIKHKDFDSARLMLNGKLAKYLTDEKSAKDLAQALKIAINSVYGLTSAKFDNPFHDIRNKDNIVAKRGALFMINLKHLVQEKGFTVAHIKTDSIKIPDATPEIIQFVMDYGKMYGYTFEHEATYEKMCLVNDAVYIAKYAEGGEGWTATGTQFQVPYVFKTLFSHEPIEFKDMCETKSVTSALYLDMNEGLPKDEHNYVFVGKVSSFCPIVAGAGGGELVRLGKDADGNPKYSSATGAKGYRWLESEMVRQNGLEDKIDISYYRKQVDEAIEDINHYGDFYSFAD